MKLVSVIILSYRNLDSVAQTADSVMLQDYPEIELIISDDASPDYAEKQPGLAEILEKKKGQNIREIIWVSHAENVGTVRNCNDAVRASHGEFLMTVAAEDLLAGPQVLRHLTEVLERENGDLVFGRLQGLTPEGKTVDHLLSCESDYGLLASYTVEQTRNRLFARNFLPAPCAMKRRRLYEQNGLHPESIRLIEDYPYWLILTGNGVKFHYLDEKTVIYRLNHSGSGHYGEAFMEDMYRIYDQFIFPYDHRYGAFQGLYNRLKRHGLDYYMARARWAKMSAWQRLRAGIRYLPFFVYTGLLDWKNERKNQKDRRA